MQTVKIKKVELLKKIQENRNEHVAEYLTAYEGYKQAVVKQLEEMLENAKNGDVRKTAVNLPVPQNHIKEYDRVIAMLLMSVENTIELTVHDFDRYVLDEWDWKEMTKMSFSTYLNKV